MLALAERLLLNLRQLRGMSSQQRREAIKRRLGPRLVSAISRFRAKQEINRLRRIERWHGMEAAHRALWGDLASKRGWSAVQNRLLALSDENPAEIQRLVSVGLQLSADPLVLVAMSQHPLSAAALAQALAEERAAPLPEMDKRLSARADYAAAFLVASALTGDDAAMNHARDRIPDVVGDPFLQIVESFGQRPAAPAEEIEPLLRGLRRNGLRHHKRHRLVIAENFQDPSSFLPLLCGADRVTLLGLDDTFGKAGFAHYQRYPGVGEIVVEHIRSRITRFSPEYVGAHAQTRDAAIELARTVDSVPGLVPTGDLPYIELAIADHLFFQLLRLRAIEELLKDPDFDHIVVATRNHVPASGYILTLAGVAGLKADPRVELMSLARTVSQRQSFSGLLPAILTGPRPVATSEAWLPPISEIAPQLWRNAQAIAAPLPDQAVPNALGVQTDAPSAGGSVLVVATSNTAYDYSTARYAAALAKAFPTAFAICGGTASAIQRELSKTDVAPGSVPFRLLRREYLLNNTAFIRWMSGQLNLFCARRGLNDSLAHVIACAPARLVTNVIQSQVVHGQVLECWFSRMKSSGDLPRVIALSAARAPSVAQFAAAARRHDVPTLLMEAHGLNSNYCRYAKIGADYYGVISEHFRSDAVKGFDIDPARTRVLGTPRIIASPGHDRDLARAEISEGLGHDLPMRSGGLISFFSQPSNWSHVAGVWRMVLAAAQVLDLQVLLKPHPEETASRIGQYSTIASQMQVEDRVQLINSAPKLLIEASDVVLTGYSAAALDAAVIGRPVICVTVGDADYPVDQHEIARAPLVRDLAGLIAALRHQLAEPDAEAYSRFLAAEPQFAEGPDERLRAFMAEIQKNPQVRPAQNLPAHLFLEPPHPTFSV